MMESKMVPAKTCPVCKKEFSKKSNLTRHLQSNVHDKTPLLKSFKCPLPLCNFIAESKVVILQHYGNSHGFNLEPTNLTFKNTEAFYEWKGKLESDTNAQFINSKGSKISKSGTIIHFICHRDGNFVSRSKNVKHLKIQGSNKINAHCPARIACRITEKCVQVDYVDSHIGHEMDLGRFYISEAEKTEIVKKKGKITEKLKSLRIRHKNSLIRSFVVVRDTECEDRWSVSSSSNGNIYSITRGNTSCQCQLRCAKCKTCIHAFSCSCIDFSIKWNMCEHIHTVCTFLKEGCMDQSNDVEVAQNLKFEEEEEEVIITQLIKKQDTTAWNKEEEIRNVVNRFINITNLIENQEQLEAVKKHIAPLEHIIKAMSTKRNIDALKENHPELLEPANKKMKYQPRFASTTSTRKCEKRLSNPSETERQELGLEMIWLKQ